ncbi:MAG: hypothetical protein KAR20_15390 [Candidatus Heimdallarchaeota archaeon]|nr:hypothetical protein [Candidatus Heimdallarchaeota archaeon]
MSELIIIWLVAIGIWAPVIMNRLKSWRWERHCKNVRKEYSEKSYYAGEFER